ncbi:Dipeptide-binding ABC transporter, periplasmic substrate-binding component [Methanosarcina siciliae HI350]|uniref:Dipeptide-binding ABC transporter, periplasmic substrate-binding component n=1 Tax=Methanosarcina siciliae HI350 TaxID=1434119 RepID=A0A0E3LBN1_9EURY|nr:ABC transporter substrate-binding protein [Methanosarcina siciliae]AKB34061.1 Dipeptide-binding ABC transporter, periplasmic substrate-binding component [Methanosarcina siciliae HI350]
MTSKNKNENNHIFIILIFIIIASVFFSGCADSDSNTGEASLLNDSEDAGENISSEKDGNLRAVMIFGPDESLDPGYKWVGWYVREAGIYETLFAYDADMNLVPELAESYESLNDTAWQINLRLGVKFHDGTPFNAEAVIFSINRVLDPDNTRHTEYDFIESVSAKNDTTVIIRTKEPYAPTIASLSDPLLSIVSPEAEDLTHKPVGTGPFKFKNYKEGLRLSVLRNEDYWGGDVKLESATIDYVSDPLTRSLKLQADDCDLVRGIPATESEIINENPDLEVLSKETLRLCFMYVNANKEPLDDLRVRQALNYAINRDQVVSAALEGEGVPATGVFPSTLPWSSNEKLEGYDYSSEKAKELLSETGITDTDGDGWLEYEGEPFELTIRTYEKRAELKPTAEVIASQFEKIGIKTEVIVLETGALSADTSDGNYDLSLYAWGVAPAGDPDYFLSYHFESSGEQAGWTGYSNSEVDEWIKEARESTSQEERQEYYDLVQAQVLEDSPEIFVFYYTELDGINKRVKGYEIYPNEISFITKDIYIEE